MDPALVIGLTEVAKMALSAYFQAMALSGKSADETRQTFLVVQQSFEMNRPELLKDV